MLFSVFVLKLYDCCLSNTHLCHPYIQSLPTLWSICTRHSNENRKWLCAVDMMVKLGLP